MKKRGRKEGSPRAGQATPGARARGVHPCVPVLTVASTFADTQGDVPKAPHEGRWGASSLSLGRGSLAGGQRRRRAGSRLREPRATT